MKTLEKEKAKETVAYDAFKQIAAIYRLDNQLSDLSPEERVKQRHLVVKPLVEGFFAWLKVKQAEVLPKSETGKGIQYCLNQEPYIKTFLDKGNVPLDNNACEPATRGFCIGKYSWHLIDAIEGANASAVIYSLAETTKANHLKPYKYFEYLLTEIPKHMDDTDLKFIDNLLPWAEALPEDCRKVKTE